MKKYIHITAGKGPVECQYAAAKVLNLFLTALASEGAVAQVVQRTVGSENMTIQSATVCIEKCSDSFLKEWLGTILWIEKSTVNTTKKRKHWFIGIFELKDFKELVFKESEIEFTTMRSSGPGGQNVNKVNSAVRAKHIPTGVTGFSQDSRSQHQNKQLAIERLREKLNEENLNQVKSQIAAKWEQHILLERGNPIQTFSGEKFGMKKEIKNYKKQRNQLKNELHKEINRIE